jgi:hypothetical protein
MVDASSVISLGEEEKEMAMTESLEEDVIEVENVEEEEAEKEEDIKEKMKTSKKNRKLRNMLNRKGKGKEKKKGKAKKPMPNLTKKVPKKSTAEVQDNELNDGIVMVDNTNPLEQEDMLLPGKRTTSEEGSKEDVKGDEEDDAVLALSSIEDIFDDELKPAVEMDDKMSGEDESTGVVMSKSNERTGEGEDPLIMKSEQPKG